MNKLGFGYLRLPMKDGEVDTPLLNAMTDAFLDAGGDYFDTAYTYLDGKSEAAVKTSLTSRHPRERYRLATKLPGYSVRSHEECFALFNEQLERCGVEYFDVYLLHWLNRKHYARAEQYREFEFLQALKADGRARKIGFSFHDTAELLDEILTKHPEVDIVLLQINYIDWDSASIQSRRCYETAVKHGKSVIVMEPVKGGSLANPPEAAQAVLKELSPAASPAFQALRFAMDLPGVELVLSGMNSMEQLADNLRAPEPLTDADREIYRRAAEIINGAIAVPCTGCGYCVTRCPKGIRIPDMFRLYNEYCRDVRHAWKISPAYRQLTLDSAKASECIACGACAAGCPQKLEIPELLTKVREKLEK